MLERTAPDFRRIRELAADLDLNSIIRDIDRIAPESAFDDDSDDLFAAPSPAIRETEKPAEKAPEKPESDQMEFDF